MHKIDLEPWNEELVREYAGICGNRCAADLLILIGPDSFAGSYEEYNALLSELSCN